MRGRVPGGRGAVLAFGVAGGRVRGELAGAGGAGVRAAHVAARAGHHHRRRRQAAPRRGGSRYRYLTI